MSDINNIDDLFKSKLKGREAAYSASAWSGAESLLAKHYKALLIKKVLLITIPTIIVTAIGLGVLFSNNQDINESPQGEESALTTISTKESSKSSTSELSGVESESSIALEEDNTADLGISGSENSYSSPTTGENIIESTSTDLQTAEIAAESAAEQTDIQGNQEELDASSEAFEDDMAETTDSRIPMPPGFGDFLEDISLEDEPASVGTTTNDNTLPDIVSLKDANALLQTANSELELMPGFDVSQISNWSSGLADQNRVPERLMSEIRKIELAISGGGLLSTGMRGNDWQNEKSSLGWHAGLTIQYYIKERWFARTGAIIHQRSAINSRRVDWPAFYILPNDVNAPINLRYVDIPLQMGYRLGSRHEVAFGLAFAPLLNYTRTTSALPSQDVQEYVKDGTSRDGFANFDVAALLDYKYQVTERLDIKVEGRFGAFDVTDNAYFGSGIIDDRNHQVRLGLNYRIIRR